MTKPRQKVPEKCFLCHRKRYFSLGGVKSTDLISKLSFLTNEMNIEVLKLTKLGICRPCVEKVNMCFIFVSNIREKICAENNGGGVELCKSQFSDILGFQNNGDSNAAEAVNAEIVEDYVHINNGLNVTQDNNVAVCIKVERVDHDIEDNEIIPEACATIKVEPLDTDASTFEELDTDASTVEEDELQKPAAEKLKTPICCGDCNSIFTYQKRFDSHKAYGNGQCVFECKFCDKVFLYSRKRQYDHHVRAVHTKECPYTCDICEKAFVTSYRMEVHKRVHTDMKSFACNSCEKSYKTTGQLKRHKRLHDGDKSFICTECGKGFFERKNLEQHVRAVHTMERPFTCDVCEKGFVTPDKLKIHKRVHTGEKPCVCEDCGHAFYSRGLLSTHRKYHHTPKEEDDITCDLCSATFSCKRNLAYHVNVTHSTSRDFHCHMFDKKPQFISHTDDHEFSETDPYKQPLQCNVCGKTFSDTIKLKRHVLAHSGKKDFKCSICSKGFLERHKLTRHMLTHTGKREFGCSECARSFTLKHNLTIHMRIHGNIREFQCLVCERTFVQKIGLQRHLRSMHRDYLLEQSQKFSQKSVS